MTLDSTPREPATGAPSEDERAARDELRALYEAKARSELIAADAVAPGSDIVANSGCLVAQVALVKGLPGPAEAAGGAALSGPDGTASESALARLGFDPTAAFRILSRPEPELEGAARVARLRRALEAVDPAVVIALDKEAAEDVRDAFCLERLAFGKPTRAMGRTIVALDGLEASLGDQNRKMRVWKQLQSIELPNPDRR